MEEDGKKKNILGKTMDEEKKALSLVRVSGSEKAGFKAMWICRHYIYVKGLSEMNWQTLN